LAKTYGRSLVPVHCYEARKVRVVKGFCVLPFGVFRLKILPVEHGHAFCAQSTLITTF
jgi:hypothetical protein